LTEVSDLVAVAGDDERRLLDGGQHVLGIGRTVRSEVGDLAQEALPLVTAGDVDMSGAHARHVVAELGGDAIEVDSPGAVKPQLRNTST